MPRANKSLGQHWLSDMLTLSAICDSGQVESGDTVLEIGPGTGTLTDLLTRRAKSVVAVEFDTTLAAALPARVPAENLKVINTDILSFDLGSLPPDYKVIANIPYYLTSKLIRVLSETPNRAKKVVLLIQKEVAERAAAEPGNMSLLSVSAQYYWRVSLGQVVSARLFTPPPKVDSQILILDRRDSPLFASIDERLFFRIVKAGFAARRKTLENSLSGGLRFPKQTIRQALSEAGIRPSERAQELSLNAWHELYKQIQTIDVTAKN